MIVTKKVISRRAVLRGVGVALGLPLLDSMVPALTAAAKTAATPPNRLGVVYVPNGIVMDKWTPLSEGPLALTAILRPLAPFRDKVLVLSGLTNKNAFTGTHAFASTKFLTGMPPHRGSEILAGVSVDQVTAKTLGAETRLASLEVALETSDSAGTCADSISCAYTNTIAWRSPTTPLPMERNPRAVFERLFGDVESTDHGARQVRLQQKRSILDSVLQKLVRFQRGLGASDRSRMAEYLDAVREVERGIEQAAEGQGRSDLEAITAPSGVPDSYDEHAKLLYDLQVLAYQADLTRVITFMIGRELSGQTYPQIGVPDSHHPISHHQDDPEKLEKLTAINVYHLTLFAYFVEKLKATADGDGSLLDHVTLLYGSGISDGDSHSPDNLPILLVGGGGGKLQGGRHLRYAPDTRLANLHVTLLNQVGVAVGQFGDSNGTVSL